MLKVSWIDTPLDKMVAIADEEGLYLLEFGDWPGLGKEVERLKKKHSDIFPGSSEPLRSIARELHDYFSGKLQEFRTPLFLEGSSFQKRVWEELRKIPFGETRSYLEIACALGKPSASRAVGGANGANPFAIIIPCHRVIHANGGLSGYSSGSYRKRWLIDHEQLQTPH